MKYQRKTLNQKRIKPGGYQVHVLKERCKGCRICIEFCPQQVLRESSELNQKGYLTVSANGNNRCLNCGLCELLCPDFALRVVPFKEKKTDG